MILTRKYDFNFNKAIELLEENMKIFKCYSSELKLYKKILKSFENLTFTCENELGKKTQFFEVEFGKNTKNSGLEYTMVWNVQMAEKLINDKKLIPVDYEVKNYISSFYDTDINKYHASKYNPTPIIIAKGPHFEDIVIDGNHRMHYAIVNKKTTIPAYILNIEESIECIHTEELKKIFIIHKNILEIVYRFKDNNKVKLRYSKNFEKRTLYPLHNSFIKSLLSRLFLFFEI